MRIGLALPNTVPNIEPTDLLSWARAADDAGFSTLATLDRLVYDNYECLTLLSAAAAVTSRIKLMTAVMIAPLRSNAALLAKQAATVDRLSNGRLVLGMAVGARGDDFKASGVSYPGRGAAFEAQLEELHAVWGGARRGFAGGIGPKPSRPGGPELILGGQSRPAIARMARHGEGWISGSGGPGMFTRGAAAVREAWTATGRSGKPKMMALAYYALSYDAAEVAAGYLNDYYGFAPPYAQAVLRNAAIGVDGLKQTITAFGEAGCDELILAPCSADLGQLGQLAQLAEWAAS
jgi:alkanesulfonate monooxygenase SsuD/methylene tetrahydromethanopterin reductase-like flavin-dependent oxidoreductase (luciferase family)